MRGWVGFAALLEDLGWTPATVLDVGVADGTSGILDFPEAYNILVEPMPQFEESLRELLASRSGEAHLVAAASFDGQVSMTRGTNRWDSRICADEEQGELLVPARRLDGIVPVHVVKPALAKFDVQGWELDAINGLGSRLSDFDFVVVECSLNPWIGPDVLQVMIAMFDKGYVLWDIIELVNRPFDNSLGQLDAVFVPARHELRRSTQWS